MNKKRKETIAGNQISEVQTLRLGDYDQKVLLEGKTPQICMKMSGYVRKYTSGYFNPNEPKAPLGEMIKGLMFSPDYRFKDFLAIVQNGYAKNHSIMDELDTVDLREDLRLTGIPYHIIQGETDVVTSTRLVKAFVETAGNENLTCTVIANAAHMPGVYGMRAVMDEIEKLK